MVEEVGSSDCANSEIGLPRREHDFSIKGLRLDELLDASKRATSRGAHHEVDTELLELPDELVTWEPAIEQQDVTALEVSPDEFKSKISLVRCAAIDARVHRDLPRDVEENTCENLRSVSSRWRTELSREIFASPGADASAIDGEDASPFDEVSISIHRDRRLRRFANELLNRSRIELSTRFTEGSCGDGFSNPKINSSFVCFVPELLEQVLVSQTTTIRDQTHEDRNENAWAQDPGSSESSLRCCARLPIEIVAEAIQSAKQRGET